jgi:hypothetical protein
MQGVSMELNAESVCTQMVAAKQEPESVWAGDEPPAAVKHPVKFARL